MEIKTIQTPTMRDIDAQEGVGAFFCCARGEGKLSSTLEGFTVSTIIMVTKQKYINQTACHGTLYSTLCRHFR